MEKIILFFLFPFLGLLVSGCASLDGEGGLEAQPIPRQIEAIAQLNEGRNILYVDVPAPNNAISKHILLGALAAGSGSNTVDTLVRLLGGGKEKEIGVVGADGEVNRATLAAVLKELKGRSLSVKVYWVGPADTGNALQASAREVGIELVPVTSP